MSPADQRAVEIQPEELRELQPVRRHLPDEDTATHLDGVIEQTHRSDAWDWLCFCAPWLGLSTILAVILLVVLEIIAPWKT